MASSVRYGAQSALMTCKDHTNEELDIYCKTCKKPICLGCTMDKHKNHQYEKMKRTAHGLRQNARLQKLQYTSFLNSVVNGTLAVLTYLTTANDESFSKNSSELESTRSELYEIVDSLINKEKKKCKHHHSKQKKKIEKRKERFDAKAERMKVLIETLETDISNSDVIELHNELQQTFKDLQNLATVPFDVLDEMIYMKGHIEESSIESMVGNTTCRERNPSSVCVSYLREHKCGDTKVNCICPISVTDAWVHCTQTTMNKLVTEEGVQEQSRDMKHLVYNFDISKNGTMYFCVLETKTVHCIGESGEVGALFSTEPLIPTFIALTRSGDFLVSLVDEVTRTLTPSSRRLVRRLTQSGEALQDYEYDNDGKTPLFVFLNEVAEHCNGDICICNQYEIDTDQFRGEVYGFTCNSRLKFRYSGRDKGLNPLDMCCDMMGNTLITDTLNECVHLIDSDGKLVKYIQHEETLKFEPYAIALAFDKLWISECVTGIIKVYNYKY